MKRLYRLILLILFISFSHLVLGQEELTISTPFKFEQGHNTYIFADTAKIRDEPGLTAKVIDTLLAGDEITITEVSETKTTSSGKEAPWYKVSYSKNEIKETGYVWGALLSFSAHRRGNTKFVYGIDKVIIISTEKEYVDDVFASVKVIENGVIKRKVSFKFDNSDSANYPSAITLDNRGLTSNKIIFKCTFSGGACAVPTYDFYFLWNGNSLYSLPNLISSVDAVSEGPVDWVGITQEYIFPKDKGGKPNQIILYESTSDYDKNEKLVEKETYKQYSWNGSVLKLLS